ncbi:MAG: hypothetical protein HYR97_00580 [Candidatus Melainabacteria bacterium]|nr:hypothetical protein [Candidatus Melainabacteria bacterium]
MKLNIEKNIPSDDSSDSQNISLSVSLEDIKSRIPRINLRKIKLGKTNNLEKLLKEKNITRVLLDDTLYSLEVVSKEALATEKPMVSVLRKRTDVDKKEKQVTFSMKAEAAQEEENVIFSPSDVPMPPYKEDVLSTSGEPKSLAWPPVPDEKASEKKEEKKIEEKKEEVKKEEAEKEPDEVKKKKKPYFLSLPDEVEEQKSIEKENQPKEETPVGLPWGDESKNYEGLDTLFSGGLESELLGIPKNLPSKQEISNEPDLEFPQFQEGIIPFDIPNKTNVIENKLETKVLSKDDKLKRRTKTMFGKLKLSPISIILIGGTAATLGYLMWVDNSTNQYGVPPQGEQTVRTLFKQKHVLKKSLGVAGEAEVLESEDKLAFKPINEAQRLSLIQMAREAIESRIDPFGFESFLPKLETAKKADTKPKEPGEVGLSRRQVELVGVISTSERNLALVNVYTVEYSVKINDDKETRNTALKSALSMAVPNRIEISVLDPVEDWFVKSIHKSESRTEDPYVVLVRGQEQFNLKVGEKVLLPEDITFEDIVLEMEEEGNKEQQLLDQLGLTLE